MQESGIGFGTSGARGLADAMTDKVCYAYTVAFLDYLHAIGDIGSDSRVAIAGDYRSSTPRIIAAVIRAVQDRGYLPIYCGFIPSPAVALYGISHKNPAIMVTGSHIPDDRNGIKFNKPAGEILKNDEAGIRARSVNITGALFNTSGWFVDKQNLPQLSAEPYVSYRSRYLDFFAPETLKGMRIGVYEHSSVARELLLEIVQGLGAEPVRLGYSDRFIPVDTEAVRPEDIELARKWSVDHKFDAIISTDGDGDRPLVSDERGEWLRGDVAGILTAQFLGAKYVVTPVSSNSAVEKSENFDGVSRTKIGSPYVISEMCRLLTQGATGVVGYEANGGFLQADTIEKDARMLSPLPTRDAMIVALSILAMSRKQEVSISQLVEQLPARFTNSDRLKNFPTELSQLKIAEFTSVDEQHSFQQIEKVFEEQFGKVLQLNQTDGLRIIFDSGEVVHLRPSGNAPELRCYTEADTPVRAAAILKQCLKIMEGWRECAE